MVLVVPRALNLALKPGSVYPLYGFHYVVFRSLSVFSNAKFYQELFGDSSYVVNYLRALGYKFRGLAQTGSNFGMEQHHDNPFLCEIGKGTMVSDGLTMVNAELSNASFKLSSVVIPANSFLGNHILMPAHARLGQDCLLGTKVAVPIDGPMRAGVGLLGSPCFEIPRSVRRDRRFDQYQQEHIRLPRLRQKNASNIITMALLLLAQCVAFTASALSWHYSYFKIDHYGGLFFAVFAWMNLALMTLYFVLIDRLSLGFRPLQPQHCSIYDDYFWRHERHWKLGLGGEKVALRMLNGTPFKGLVWRLLGVRVGKKLFDDGGLIIEKTLVTLGDNCCLNDKSVIHSHSLEDGVFKSDHIVIHDGCTVSTAALVHYGVEMENNVCIAPDSFLMKGEHPAAYSRWCGNPAREIRMQQAEGVPS
jgi:non-ribosomal peptide synthetase-like protein